MNEKGMLRNVSVRLDAAVIHRMKLYAIRHHTTMQALVGAWIHDALIKAEATKPAKKLR